MHRRLQGRLREIGQALQHLPQSDLTIDVAQRDHGKGLLVPSAQSRGDGTLVPAPTSVRQELLEVACGVQSAHNPTPVFQRSEDSRPADQDAGEQVAPSQETYGRNNERGARQETK